MLDRFWRIHMRRRDFIRVVAGGVALAAPVSARYQQAVIGYLSVSLRGGAILKHFAAA